MNSSSSRILVEVCVGSVADIERAVAAGADRLELCSALELGGLTPSIGLIESALAASPIPIVAMLRPRPGGFRYDDHEFAAMRRDAERFLDLGASGVVFGILDERGKVDAARCRELTQLIGPAHSVFHRAFDFVNDQPAALETLIDVGITRVLTSGSRPTAAEGAQEIRNLISLAASRIQILPGGGISGRTVVELACATGCSQVHLGAAAPSNDGSIAETAVIELVDQRFMQGTHYRAVSGELVADTVAALRNAKLR